MLAAPRSLGFLGFFASVLGLAVLGTACGDDDDASEREQHADAARRDDEAAGQLFDALIASGEWERRDGAIESDASDVVLLAFDRVITLRPGQNETVHLAVTGESEDQVVATLLQFRDVDGYLETEVGAPTTITPGGSFETDGFDQTITVPEGLCSDVCAGDYALAVTIAVRLADGTVTGATDVTLIVSCDEDGLDCAAEDLGAPPPINTPDPDAVDVLAAAARAYVDVACTCDPDSQLCAMSADEQCAREVLWSHLDDLSGGYAACADQLDASREACEADCGRSACSNELGFAFSCSFYLGGSLMPELDACRLPLPSPEK